MRVRVCVCVCVCVQLCVHVCLSVYVCMDICVYVCVYMGMILYKITLVKRATVERERVTDRQIEKLNRDNRHIEMKKKKTVQI